MFTPITFPSALEFWLTFDGKRPLMPISEVLCSNALTAPDRNALLNFAVKANIKNTPHILVPHRNQRRQGEMLITHVMPKNLPPESFVFVSGIPIISPELCFLLAANHLPLADLSLLSSDLSATYAIDRTARFGQITRDPITSVNKISNYLSKIQNVDGIQKAKKAIRFALDGSHSPMESKIGVTNYLPKIYGGFASDKPELNAIVTLSREGAIYFQREVCCCDLYWEKQKVIIEYDSDLVHSNADQIRQDKKKSTALFLSGFKVLNLTKDQFRNINTVEETFLTIRKALGLRTRKGEFKGSKEVRENLIKRFFLTSGSPDWLDWVWSLSNNTTE